MAHGFTAEFEAHLAECGAGKPLGVEEAATELGKFFLDRWNDASMPADADPMVFLVAGFDESDPYGRIFEIIVPTVVTPVEVNPNDFGITWGGMTYLAERLLGGYAPKAVDLAADELELDEGQIEGLVGRWQELQLPVPFQFLPLQDCVDMAIFLIDMTANVMTWTAGVQGVGGEVDVATITSTDGFRSVRQKRIHPWGEVGSS